MQLHCLFGVPRRVFERDRWFQVNRWLLHWFSYQGLQWTEQVGYTMLHLFQLRSVQICEWSLSHCILSSCWQLHFIIIIIIQSTLVEVCNAAKHAARTKISKYHELSATDILYPVSIEPAGSWDSQAVELIEEIGRRSAMETDDPSETMYLFQMISVAIQKGNALSCSNTFHNRHG